MATILRQRGKLFKLRYNFTMRVLLCLLILLFSASAVAAPTAELWQRWEKHGDGGNVDHKMWDDFLSQTRTEKHGIALLDYAGASADGRKLLDDYLEQLSQVPVDSLGRDEQRAFWINLYNALTVDVILDNYPVDSIRDISEGFFASGPWDMKLFSLAGESLSLNDIEHRILRPIWKDARLHYAVNCASIGCPNLAAVAYTAENSEELLNAGAKAYINHPRGARIDDGLEVSSIYEWFKVDFGGDDAGVIAHLKMYADAPLKESLEGVSKIARDDYNWSLNKQ